MSSEDKLSDAEYKLYEAMSEISEDCWCAGWIDGNEYALWAALYDGELKYGQSEINREELAKVAALSVQTGCWIVWLDDDELPQAEHGPYAIPLHEWSAIYESKQARATPSPAPIPEGRAEPFAWIIVRDSTGEHDGGEPMTDKAEAEDYMENRCLPGWHLEALYRIAPTVKASQ